MIIFSLQEPSLNPLWEKMDGTPWHGVWISLTGEDLALDQSELVTFLDQYRTGVSYSELEKKFKILDDAQKTRGLFRWMQKILSRPLSLNDDQSLILTRNVAQLTGKKDVLEISDYALLFTAISISGGADELYKAHAQGKLLAVENLLQSGLSTIKSMDSSETSILNDQFRYDKLFVGSTYELESFLFELARRLNWDNFSNLDLLEQIRNWCDQYGISNEEVLALIRPYLSSEKPQHPTAIFHSITLGLLLLALQKKLANYSGLDAPEIKWLEESSRANLEDIRKGMKIFKPATARNMYYDSLEAEPFMLASYDPHKNWIMWWKKGGLDEYFNNDSNANPPNSFIHESFHRWQDRSRFLSTELDTEVQAHIATATALKLLFQPVNGGVMAVGGESRLMVEELTSRHGDWEMARSEFSTSLLDSSTELRELDILRQKARNAYRSFYLLLEYMSISKVLIGEKPDDLSEKRQRIFDKQLEEALRLADQDWPSNLIKEHERRAFFFLALKARYVFYDEEGDYTKFFEQTLLPRIDASPLIDHQPGWQESNSLGIPGTG